MKQYGEYKHVLRNRAARNLLVNHTHLCSLVPSYIPKLFVVVQFLSFIQHFATTWTAARQGLQQHLRFLPGLAAIFIWWERGA